MMNIQDGKRSAKRADYLVILVTGKVVLLFVIFVLIDAEATLLMLFLVGIFFPLAGLFMLVTTFLLYRAACTRNNVISTVGGASVLYAALWLSAPLPLSYSEFRTSFHVIASLVYALCCITTALVGLRRIAQGPS